MNIHRFLIATAAFAVGAVPAWAANPMATATYTDTPLGSGEFQYNLTLNNTGTVPIGVFWFSWVPGAGFLSAKPTDVMSPSGWTDNLTNTNAAIMWMSSGSSSSLAAGGKLTGFSFDSTETPTQLAGTFMGTGIGAGSPITTSFVYTTLPNPITIASLTADGTGLVAMPASSPTQGVPEPATLGLLALGLAGMVLGRRTQRR